MSTGLSFSTSNICNVNNFTASSVNIGLISKHITGGIFALMFILRVVISILQLLNTSTNIIASLASHTSSKITSSLHEGTETKDLSRLIITGTLDAADLPDSL